LCGTDQNRIRKNLVEGKSIIMPTDPFFRMTVQDVFTIRGRGTVVTGQIENGTLNVGDEVSLLRNGSIKRVKVAGIEIFQKQLQQAQAPAEVGVLFTNLDKRDIQREDILTGSESGFSLNS
jgi:elongation factor Tu